MRLVIDSNRVIAALLKEGTTRRTLFNASHTFIAPLYLKDELRRHSSYLMRRVHADAASFDMLISAILSSVTLIPPTSYKGLLSRLAAIDNHRFSFESTKINTGGKACWPRADDDCFIYHTTPFQGC